MNMITLALIQFSSDRLHSFGFVLREGTVLLNCATYWTQPTEPGADTPLPWNFYMFEVEEKKAIRLVESALT